MNRNIARLTVGTALTAVPLAAIGITWSLWSADLPERVGTHWGFTGPADSYTATDTVILVLTWITAIALIVAFALAGAAPTRPTTRSLLAWCAAVAGGAAGIWVATATATLAAPGAPVLSWRIVYIVLGMCWGSVVFAVTGRTGTYPAGTGTAPLELGPQERAAYRTTLTSPPLLAVSAVGAVLIAICALTLNAGLWPLLTAPAVIVVLLGRIRVTADARGLSVSTGLVALPFPVLRVPLAQIATARAETIHPAAWGGWGLRMMPGRSGIILRGGPGLVLDLHDGRQFAVTLDDPEVAAGLLTALVRRSPA